jgi:hypothetical protein
MEWLAETLVPPRACEHVVGDLAEGSRSAAQYLGDLASILPRVIWSQARRRGTTGGLIFNAVLTTVVLSALASAPAAWLYVAPSVRGWLAVPVVVWVIGCTLAAAYAPHGKACNLWLLAATAVAAVGSAALVRLPLAGVILGLGGVLPLVALAASSTAQRAAMPPLSLASLPAHAQRFQTTIKWRNAREAVAGLLVIGASVNNLWRGDLTDRIASGLIVAGVLFVIGFMYLRAGARRVPENAEPRKLLQFHRDEIVRQRDVLRSVPLWYLLPFVPGLAWRALIGVQTRGARTLVGVVFVAAVFAGIWKLNLWAAAFLDKQLHTTDALEGEL